MSRLFILICLSLVCCLPPVHAQSNSPAAADKDEKGTYLGILLAPVPEVLYDQLTNLPRGQGVVITHILPESPAKEAGIERHDILLKYDAVKVTGCEQCARLIQADKIGRKVKLLVLRSGQEKKIDVKLGEGPVLLIGDGKNDGGKETAVSKSEVKLGKPSSVSVTATPLGSGNLKVTFEFYQEGTGRLKTVSCTGTPKDIEEEAKKLLPSRVQSLARKAMDRIQELDLQNAVAPTENRSTPEKR
ncbi:MAG: S1C family serine protease [Gemmataceae bacterium]